jgi:CsoR family transcriptional regulator, copper-sensing transcriptional repressor
MNEERAQIDRRLARIEGQVRGLRRLVAEDAYCMDLLNQIHAVRSALEQVAAQVASNHIRHCVLDGEHAHPTAKAMSREEVLLELEDVLKQLSK